MTRGKKQFKKLICSECKTVGERTDRLEWIYIESGGIVKSVSKINNIFFVLLERLWFCSTDCQSDYVANKLDESFKEDREKLTE